MTRLALMLLTLGVYSCCGHSYGDKIKAITMFYNHPNENTIEDEIVEEFRFKYPVTREDAQRFYEEWAAKQIISGSAGWYVDEWEEHD